MCVDREIRSSPGYGGRDLVTFLRIKTSGALTSDVCVFACWQGSSIRTKSRHRNMVMRVSL